MNCSTGRCATNCSTAKPFYSLAEARVLIEAWRRHYNTIRPHSSLGYPSASPGSRVITSAGRRWSEAEPEGDTGDGGNDALTIKSDHSMGPVTLTSP